jgi:hypothetical protein
MEATQHQIKRFQYMRECFFHPDHRKCIYQNLSDEYDEAREKCEAYMRTGNEISKLYLFKLKMMDSIIKDKNVAKATHWYGKWDEEVSYYYEEMCSNPENYSITIVNNKTGKQSTLENSIMLDQQGKMFAEEKKLFQFLLTII